ncbi:Synaptobrevin [Trypanosoma melophagium]|uniref:Synaptobrevin n=1 Tax=Trypanosoma melophagium TaxID=715481 RepID=UPI00351A0DAB|nr:Synaptobrevin [Trypanosoma melophagium]
MDQFVNKIRFWDSKESATLPLKREDTNAAVTTTTGTEHTNFFCMDETIDYTAYHLSAYDPILGVLICVGNNVPVVVLALGRRRVTLPVRKGTYWLNCHVFAGTSSFLLLSPDCLLLMDYTQRNPTSALFPRGKNETFFTCLHVPQGLTWGAVGCRNGTVVYWKLKQEENTVSLVWVALTSNLSEFCRPFLTATNITNVGCIHAMDSYSMSPNMFVAVISGVSGVCKWDMEDNSLNTFFTTSANIMGSALTACKVTPGGIYVIATTIDISVILIWSNNEKKKKDKSMELMWVLETGCRLSTHFETPSDNNEIDDTITPSCGIYIARSAGSSTQVQSDRKCQMYLLLYSAKELIEIVLDIEEKQLIQREDILANIAALRLESTLSPDEKEMITLQHIIPCTCSKYWLGMCSETELNTLIVTFQDSGPLLVERSRAKRGVKCITELVDIPHWSSSDSEMFLVKPPVETMHTMWSFMGQAHDEIDPWCTIFTGMKSVNACEFIKGEDSAILGIISNGFNGGICLLPLSNECLPIPQELMKQDIMCSGCEYSRGDGPLIILERAFPEPPQTTEVVLRVVAKENMVTLFIVHLSPPKVESFVLFSKEFITADACLTTGEYGAVARKAILVECHLESLDSASSESNIVRGGWSVILQLCDGSLILVDLRSIGNVEKGHLPYTLHFPSGLFPAGTNVTSFDTAWLNWDDVLDRSKSRIDGENSLVLFCILSEQKGLLVWDMSRMRLLAYFQNMEREDWRYDSIISHSKKGSFCVSSWSKKLLISISLKVDSSSGRTNVNDGHVFLRDFLGRILISFSVGYGVNESNVWYLKRDNIENDWHPISSADAQSIKLCINIVDNQVVVDTGKGISLGEIPLPFGRIAMVETGISWPFADLVWKFLEEDQEGVAGREEKEGETSKLSGVVSSNQWEERSLLLYGDKKIDRFRAAQLATSGGEKKPFATYQIPPECVLEHAVLCESLNAILVLSRDANKWRWFSLFDSDSANELMKPFVMTHFIHEEGCLRIYPVSIKEDGVHIYILGRGGTLGHLLLSREASEDVTRLNVGHRHFINSRYKPVPAGFRAYARFLPSPPTMKREHGFLKRLMTPPWEEVVMKIEGEILRSERKETVDEFHERIKGPLESNQTTERKKQPDPEVERKELLQGSRYTELKSIAARENVTLNEARRIMNENRNRLEERGERIAQIENRSRELAEQAATFEELARKLKEKQRNSWI